MSVVTATFSPISNASPPFAFSAQFDGASYSVQTQWNVFRQGWYVWVYDENGGLTICHPLVSGGNVMSINLCPGVFQSSTLVYDDGANLFTAIDGTNQSPK